MSEYQVARIKHTFWNADVYEPSDDTFLLVDALQAHAHSWAASPPRCCLELGCGSGYVITSLALLLRQAVPTCRCQLIAVDQSLHAIQATRRTLEAHRVSDVELLAASLLGPIATRLRGTLDVLVFNPPYVPTPDKEVAAGGIASAWAGGWRGRRVIDRVLPLLGDLLSPHGELFMVTVTENDPQGIIKEMGELGFEGRIAATRQADEEQLQILHLWKQPQPQQSS